MEQCRIQFCNNIATKKAWIIGNHIKTETIDQNDVKGLLVYLCGSCYDNEKSKGTLLKTENWSRKPSIRIIHNEIQNLRDDKQ